MKKLSYLLFCFCLLWCTGRDDTILSHRIEKQETDIQIPQSRYNKEPFIEIFKKYAFCRILPNSVVISAELDKTEHMQPSCNAPFSTLSIVQSEENKKFQVYGKAYIYPKEGCQIPEGEEILWGQEKIVSAFTTTKVNIFTLWIRNMSSLVVDSDFQILEHPFSPHSTFPQDQENYQKIQDFILSLPECEPNVK